MEGVLPRRDRARVLLLLFAVTAASWAVTAWLAQGGHHAHHHHLPFDAGAVFAMWAVMMVGMMVPTAVPFVLASGLPAAGATALLGGYLAVWTGFSVIATAMQWRLHAAGLLGSEMESTSRVLNGGLLLAAGIFQLTPAKAACIRHCRGLRRADVHTPAQAFRLGAMHGLFCTGSCVLLMLVLFVTGAMSVPAMVLLTGLVVLEKVAPGGVWIGRAAGLALVGWGCVLLSG